MTVTFKQYAEEKRAFFTKHNKKGEFKVYTSPMVDDVYHKEYCYSHGAQWCERTELVHEQAVAEAHGIKIPVTVALYKTEYWSTEAPSKYFYERA